MSSGIGLALADHLPITSVQGEVVLAVNGRQLLVVGVVWRMHLHRLDTILAVRLGGIAFTGQDFLAIRRLQAEVILTVHTRKISYFALMEALLFLFPDALERRFIRRFHVHKLASFCVAFHPMTRRSLSLGTLPHGTIAMPITRRGVSSHIDHHSASMIQFIQRVRKSLPGSDVDTTRQI